MTYMTTDTTFAPFKGAYKHGVCFLLSTSVHSLRIFMYCHIVTINQAFGDAKIQGLVDLNGVNRRRGLYASLKLHQEKKPISFTEIALLPLYSHREGQRYILVQGNAKHENDTCPLPILIVLTHHWMIGILRGVCTRVKTHLNHSLQMPKTSVVTPLMNRL